MQFKWIGQDAIPTGLLKQIQSVQGIATVAKSGSLSNTPMWYDYSDLNSTTARLATNSCFYDQQTGNAFRYVQAKATLTPGQVVTLAAPTTGTVTAAGSSTAAVITNITTTVNEAGNYLWTLDAVGTYSAASTPFSQSLRLIKSSTIGSNAVFTLSQRGSIYGNNQLDPDVLPAVPTNGSACAVIRPGGVIVGTATSAPVGICLAEVTSGNYTAIQIAGLAMVQFINTTGSAVLGQPMTVLASGIATGGTPTAFTGAGNILPLVASAAATLSLLPCQVNFLGT